MSTYYMNEGAFDLPDGMEVVDRTTHYVRVHRQGVDLTLVVARAHFPAGATIRQVADARVLDEASRLSGYQVVREAASAWDGCPAIEITSTWRHEGRAIYQHQAHFARGSRAMHLALSTSADGSAAADAWFDEIRGSLRLR